ncbi:hypothetical protein [Paenibacillus sp. PSB04]|nr:hypothetical protein [Paenibacillus sp. PSB04]UYO05230.1 hypothetical protein K2F33_04535 [Paenibacillus sp. PSB04]
MNWPRAETVVDRRQLDDRKDQAATGLVFSQLLMVDGRVAPATCLFTVQ